MEWRNFANDVIPEQRKADDHGAIGNENAFDARMRIDVAVNVAGQRSVLLPENNPIAGKNKQKEHEAWIRSDGQKISRGLHQAGRRVVHGGFGLAKEQQHDEEHQKDAESRDTKDIFQTQMRVGPIRDKGSRGAAYIDHGVVDRIADGADVFLGRPGRSADDARFDQRYSQGWEDEHASHEESKGNGVPDRCKP